MVSWDLSVEELYKSVDALVSKEVTNVVNNAEDVAKSNIVYNFNGVNNTKRCSQFCLLHYTGSYRRKKQRLLDLRESI
jgi:hypothetical protein